MSMHAHFPLMGQLKSILFTSCKNSEGTCCSPASQCLRRGVETNHRALGQKRITWGRPARRKVPLFCGEGMACFEGLCCFCFHFFVCVGELYITRKGHMDTHGTYLQNWMIRIQTLPSLNLWCQNPTSATFTIEVLLSSHSCHEAHEVLLFRNASQVQARNTRESETPKHPATSKWLCPNPPSDKGHPE